eukprot:TRINITY_DN4592_c0_g1_i1.p1 TRINITY_DN4592_c0_g1~~TRINITY_DN4592_c0_g1_i1.p1  ORF type:complete len:468 (+),score=110.85 TRINITY_DN4592_c0_g1_i1:73-1476(+)
MSPIQETRAMRVHDEISKGKGSITFREFYNEAVELDMDLSEADWRQVFDRGDANRDGVLDVDEWVIFSRFYPTLVDSFYYKIEDKWKTLSRDEDRHVVSVEVQNLRQQFTDTLAAATAAELDLSSLHKKVSELEHNCNVAAINSKHSEQLLTESHSKTQAARDALNQRHQYLNQKHADRKALTAGTAQFGPSLRKLAKDIKAKEEEHLRLQSDLQRAERHAAQLRTRVAKCGGEIDQKVIEYEDMTRRKAEHQQNLRQVHDDILSAEEEIKIAEAELHASQGIEIQVNHLYSSATADVADKMFEMKKAASQIVDIERAMLCIRDEALHTNMIAESRKVDLERLEANHRILLGVREATASAERRLISNEIALQTERESLEKEQRIYDRVSNEVLTRAHSPRKLDNMTLENIAKEVKPERSDTAKRSPTRATNNRCQSSSISPRRMTAGVKPATAVIHRQVPKVQPHEK